MIPSIRIQTTQEHNLLIKQIDKLAMALNKLPKDISWGDTTWAQDMEMLNFIKVQTLSLQNAKRTAMLGYYRDSLHIIRMAFEGYFTCRLITTCSLYPIRIKVTRKNEDANLTAAKNRIIAEAKEKLGNRFVKSYEEDEKNLVIVLRGIPVVDSNGKETGVIIPYYYNAWHSFRPIEHHIRRQALQVRLPTLRYLNGEWASATKTIAVKSDNNSAIYKNFLTFEKIIDNLLLNAILNKKTATRVLVHYNFLSNFSHCTSDSISLVSSRRLTQLSSNGLQNVYDHYLSELALLYICHLLSMYLEHTIYYFTKWRRLGLKYEYRTYRSIVKATKEQFGYFWFIFNRPHQYDKYSDANRKSNYKKKIFYRPEDIASPYVRYYDNPLARLKQMHCSQRELLTGNTFTSPFHRDDALF